MAIVDFAYYSGTYKGKSVEETDFPIMERRAEMYLKQFTHGRLTEENSVNYENVKDCICEMVDAVNYYYKQSENGGFKEKKSETTDGYSVSYSTEHKDGENVHVTMRNKLYQIARMWLLDTGLLSLVIKCSPTQI